MRVIRSRMSLAAPAVFLAALSWLAASPAHAQQEQVIHLGTGVQRPLTVPGTIQRIAVGNPDVADVQPLGSSEVLITGVDEGRTTLLIWRRGESRLSYIIDVRHESPESTRESILSLLGDIEGVQARIIGDRVVVDGETLTNEDYERVQRVADLYKDKKDKVVFLVRVGMGQNRAAARNLMRVFSEQGLKSIVVNVVGNTLFLEGTVESEDDLKKAELIVKAMGTQVENLITVGIKRMVLVEVQIVEIRRVDDTGFGITYPTNLQSADGAGLAIRHDFIHPPTGNQPKNQTSLSASGTLETDFALRMRFDNGYGRLLSRPKLVAASGESAEFQVGGEVPVVMFTMNMINIDFKEFGVLLNLTPTADRQGNIQTTIEAEVSDVDRSLTVRAGGSEIPGFRTRKVKTNVTVRHGETIVLSGLFNYDQQKNVSKVPLLGHIPILGELFKSRGFVENKNELAIFVTPTIVNPDSDRIRETIDKIKERYKDASSSVGFNIFD